MIHHVFSFALRKSFLFFMEKFQNYFIHFHSCKNCVYFLDLCLSLYVCSQYYVCQTDLDLYFVISSNVIYFEKKPEFPETVVSTSSSTSSFSIINFSFANSFQWLQDWNLAFVERTIISKHRVDTSSDSSIENWSRISK